jgi:hypothetical protein
MSILQNLVVLQDRSNYKAVTDFTHEIAYASEHADRAIQYAVDALAGQGGTVTLGRGTYPLDQPVALADNVWLRGHGRGSKLLVSEHNAPGIGLTCHEHVGVVISDLAVSAGENRNAQVGIVVDDSGDCQVRCVTLTL